MITRSLYRTIRLGEVYFDEPLDDTNVDLVRFHQVTAPVRKSMVEEFHTRLIELSPEEEALFAAFKKDTRSEIRRAEREGAVCESWEDPDDVLLAHFFSVYDAWASGHKLPPANRARLRACAEKRHLVLSRGQGAEFANVWHAYYLAGTRVRLLHSINAGHRGDSAKALVGRVNRLLHWHDIRFFKRKGCTIYDLGGWYIGTADAKRLAINRFKAEFGGVVVREFNCVLPVSTLGRAVCGMRRLLMRTGPRDRTI